MRRAATTLWEHPDLLPAADDLDGDEAIDAFVAPQQPLDLSGLDDLPSVDDPQSGATGRATTPLPPA